MNAASDEDSNRSTTVLRLPRTPRGRGESAPAAGARSADSSPNASSASDSTPRRLRRRRGLGAVQEDGGLSGRGCVRGGIVASAHERRAGCGERGGGQGGRPPGAPPGTTL